MYIILDAMKADVQVNKDRAMQVAGGGPDFTVDQVAEAVAEYRSAWWVAQIAHDIRGVLVHRGVGEVTLTLLPIIGPPFHAEDIEPILLGVKPERRRDVAEDMSSWLSSLPYTADHWRLFRDSAKAWRKKLSPRVISAGGAR